MTTRKYIKREGPWVESIPLIYRHKLPISNVEQYWKGLERGVIYATRCTACGSVYYPPQAYCPSCGPKHGVDRITEGGRRRDIY
ncbi:Zn-ribbon domain-containing OB-fold protein [Pyrobaculum aerophilum]|uniref:Zn-ribbon domain-containing OB-fold protein n=1 Tax=Pyrobaculum aerophilum TaxID=13773 RepID=UPI0021622611|nr:zinc ribbon domain-containing protein [Pyrobaculum aerophilum]